ncbi:IS1 family transposase [Escherichia coli]
MESLPQLSSNYCLGRKSLSFSKSVELHDKVIGHYLNIKHYQ